MCNQRIMLIITILLGPLKFGGWRQQSHGRRPCENWFAGIKNIHAYSWLAHSRKYLESVERERRHSHVAKVCLPVLRLPQPSRVKCNGN